MEYAKTEYELLQVLRIMNQHTEQVQKYMESLAFIKTNDISLGAINSSIVKGNYQVQKLISRLEKKLES